MLTWTVFLMPYTSAILRATAATITSPASTPYSVRRRTSGAEWVIPCSVLALKICHVLDHGNSGHLRHTTRRRTLAPTTILVIVSATSARTFNVPYMSIPCAHTPSKHTIDSRKETCRAVHLHHINIRELLRRRHNDGPAQRCHLRTQEHTPPDEGGTSQRAPPQTHLTERYVNVARAGRCINHKVVQLAPLRLPKQLREAATFVTAIRRMV